MQVDDFDSPLSVLETFIAKEIVPDMKYTNSYEEIMIKLLKIQERTKQSLRSLFNLWEPVTEEDCVDSSHGNCKQTNLRNVLV